MNYLDKETNKVRCLGVCYNCVKKREDEKKSEDEKLFKEFMEWRRNQKP